MCCSISTFYQFYRKLLQYVKITITKVTWFNLYKLKENITKVISEIPKEKYKNIFKGPYERQEKYVAKNKTRKVNKNYL